MSEGRLYMQYISGDVAMSYLGYGIVETCAFHIILRVDYMGIVESEVLLSNALPILIR